MKKSKIMMFILVGLLILMIIFSIVLKTKISNNEKKNTTINENTELQEESNVLHAVNSWNDYYMINTITEKYYNAIYNLKNKTGYITSGEEENINSDILYNMLGKKYIETNNIQINDITNIYNKSENMKTIIENIYYISLNTDVTLYLTEVINKSFTSQLKEEVTLVITIDNSNNTFAVYPQEYLKTEKIDKLNITDTSSLNKFDTSIEKNYNNKVFKKVVTDDEITQYYWGLYKFYMIYDREDAFYMLDEEYRNKKFGTIENYQNYIKDNLIELFSTSLEKYDANNTENYMHYICIDQYENYYIFEEESISKAKVFLDTYTVDLPEFTKKYSKASDENKVAMNLEKIRLAMNDADYKYVYNKLDESFKIKNYPVQQNFESIVKSQLFPKNEFEITSIEKQNEIYIVNVKVTDAAKASQEEKNMKVVMQLGENTDFVMSFSMQ